MKSVSNHSAWKEGANSRYVYGQFHHIKTAFLTQGIKMVKCVGSNNFSILGQKHFKMEHLMSPGCRLESEVLRCEETSAAFQQVPALNKDTV